jgi:hypothetical protein
MGRPRKYDNDQQRKDAHKQTHKKYDTSYKSAIRFLLHSNIQLNIFTFRRQLQRYYVRSRGRLEKTIIALALKNSEWAVDRTVFPSPLPFLPPDIRVLAYSEDDLWVEKAMSMSSAWREGFLHGFYGEKGKRYSEWMDWYARWTEPAALKAANVELFLLYVQEDSLEGMLDGWNAARIVKSGLERMIGIGKNDKDRFINTATEIIERILTLDTDTKMLNREIKTKLFSKRHPKIQFVTKQLRLWRYMELCILRHELWQRWAISRAKLIKLFDMGLLGWQRCFANSDIRVQDMVRLTWDQARQKNTNDRDAGNLADSEYSSDDATRTSSVNYGEADMEYDE